jgi:hypothetical protein
MSLVLVGNPIRRALILWHDTHLASLTHTAQPHDTVLSHAALPALRPRRLFAETVRHSS